MALNSARRPVFRPQHSESPASAVPSLTCCLAAAASQIIADEGLPREGDSDDAEVLLQQFCSRVPAVCVEPSQGELDALWAQCAPLPAREVADAICKQLSAAAAEHSWQASLRALRLLQHFHSAADGGRRVVREVLAGPGGEFVQHLARDVANCREAALAVLSPSQRPPSGVRPASAAPPAVQPPPTPVDPSSSALKVGDDRQQAQPASNAEQMSRLVLEDLICFDTPTPDFVASWPELPDNMLQVDAADMHDPKDFTYTPSASSTQAVAADTLDPKDLTFIPSCGSPQAVNLSKLQSDSPQAVNISKLQSDSSQIASSGLTAELLRRLDAAMKRGGPEAFDLADGDSVQETSSLPGMYTFDGQVAFNIADGDSIHEGSELADLFSFQTKAAMIKNFHSLVANAAELKADDPFDFIADHLRNIRMGKP